MWQHCITYTCKVDQHNQLTCTLYRHSRTYLHACTLYAVYALTNQCFTGNAQVLVCDSDISRPLCPSTTVTCTCMVNGTYSDTEWRFVTLNLCPSSYNAINLPQPDPCAPPAPFSNGQCCPYLTASNYAPNKTRDGPCQTSILTITVNPALHGLVFECRDYASSIEGTSSGTQEVNIIG